MRSFAPIPHASRLMISVQELFLTKLSQIWHIEKSLAGLLMRIERKICSEHLKSTVREHIIASDKQLMRLEEIYLLMDTEQPSPSLSFRNQSFIISFDKECEDLEFITEPKVSDLAAIALMQKIEHMEIALYDHLYTLSRILGYINISDLLLATLDEEVEIEEVFSALAESSIEKEQESFFAYND